MTAPRRAFVLFCLRRCFTSARIGEHAQPSPWIGLEAQECPYCGGAIDEYQRTAAQLPSSAQSDGWSE